MTYNEKAVRRAVRGAVAEAKKGMFGRTRCTDMGGRKWSVEYSVLYWHEADAKWGKAGWDCYHGCDTQREIFQGLTSAFQKDYHHSHLAVAVTVMCDGSENSERIFRLDGTEYIKNAKGI